MHLIHLLFTHQKWSRVCSGGSFHKVITISHESVSLEPEPQHYWSGVGSSGQDQNKKRLQAMLKNRDAHTKLSDIVLLFYHNSGKYEGMRKILHVSICLLASINASACAVVSRSRELFICNISKSCRL